MRLPSPLPVEPVVKQISNIQIEVTWPQVAGSLSYELDINGEIINNPARLDSRYLINSRANTLYSIKYRYVTEQGNSEWSNSVTILSLLNPPKVNASAIGKDIVVNWDPVSGASGYYIVINNGTKEYVNGTSHTHSNLPVSTWISYSVQAVSDLNNSNWTSISAVSAPSIPLPPTVISQTNSISISWSRVNGTIGYDVEIDGTIATVVDPSYVKYGLLPNKEYTVRIRSKCNNGFSDWSTPVTVRTLMATPTLTATEGNTDITLTWPEVSGALSYNLRVDGVIINVGNTTSYVHRNLVPGTQHKYQAQAVSSEGVGNWSSEIIRSTFINAPDPVNIVPTSSSLTISWSSVSGATGYDLELDGTVISLTGTSYTKSGYIANTYHTIRVRSKSANTTSQWSRLYAQYTQLITPTVSSSSMDRSITLSWSAITGATAYKVIVDGFVYETSLSSFHISGFQPGTSHTFQVQAISSNNQSALSPIQTIWTIPNVPDAPVVIPGTNQLRINWNAVTGASGYDLEINGSVVAVSGTSFTRTGLTANTRYTIRMRSKNASGTSSWGTPVIQDTLLATPVVSASSTSTSITLTWPTVSGASYYLVTFDGVVYNNGNSVTFTQPNLIPNTQHTYQVQAVSSFNSSETSAVVTRFTAPSSPVIQTTSSTTTSFVVSWLAIPGATGYDIEVNGVVVTSVSGTSYTRSGLQSKTQYTVRIRSKNSTGVSNWSPVITITTQ